MSTRSASEKTVPSGRKNTATERSSASAKLRKKWRFAPDAIGMVNGPKNLSRRKRLKQS